YQAVDQAVQDENGGGDPQEIQLRRPGFRLLLSTDDLTGYEALPVGRVRRSGDGQAVGMLDETFFPPLLNCAAWEHLREGILRKLHDLIDTKIEIFADQVRAAGMSFNSQERGDLERVMFLHQLNEYSATLGALIRTSGVHPFSVYAELCRIMGGLS